MTLCELEQVGEDSRCRMCGNVYPQLDSQRGKAICGKPRLQLGDALERQLKAWGITQQRYAEVKAAFGLPPKCNCQRRKEWLNKVGKYLGL